MFGKDVMFGTEERRVYEKGRVILPAFCQAEKDDLVVILSKKDYLEIWGLDEFKEFLEETKVNKFMYADDITAFVAFMDVKVDVQKRINLSRKLVEDYQLQDGVEIEGKGKFIRIWHKDAFQKYQENLKEVGKKRC